MADIDREKFAYAVAAKLDEQELSYSQAVAKYAGITRGLLSKIRNGFPVSAGNMLIICKHFELPPFDYLDIEKRSVHGAKSIARKNKIERYQSVPRDTVKHPHLGRRMCLPHPKNISLGDLAILHSKKGKT